MLEVLQSGFLKALGWSLIDSLWQLGGLWLLYTLITRNGRKLTANQRHNLAFFSLALGAAWFLGTIVLHLVSGKPSVSLPVSSPEFLTIFSNALEPLLPVFSSGYLLMTAVLMIRLYRQFQYTRLISNQGLKKADPEIRVFLRQLAPGMGINKEIRVYLSSLIATPLTIGFWKPVILLPVALVNNLSIKQTEALILHELNHIQRNDFLLNLLLAFADILLFFNPFARSLKEIIQQEREHRCDDLVMQFSYDPTAYAEALLMLEKQRAEQSSVAMAATGTNKLLLLARVRRLLTGETLATPVSHRLLTVLTVAIIIAFTGLYQPGKTYLEEQILAGTTPSPVVPAEYPINGETLQPFEVQPVAQPPQTSTGQEITEPASGLPEDPGTDIGIEASVARILVSEKIGEYLLIKVDEATPAYVKSETTSDFTIKFDVATPPAPPEPASPEYPYVPSKSFEFYYNGDSASLRSDQVTGEATTADREAAVKAFYRDSNLTWTEVEKEVEAAADEVNVRRLEMELEKAMAEIDWKKLNEDRNTALNEAQLSVLKSKLEIAKILREKQAKLSLKPVRQSNNLSKQQLQTQRTKAVNKVKKIVSI